MSPTTISVLSLSGVEQTAKQFINQVWNFKNRLFNLSSLGWKFGFNKRKKAHGFCDAESKTIFLSTHFLQYNLTETAVWIDTILHEIAHAIQYEFNKSTDHGPVWQAIAAIVGCAPIRRYVGEPLVLPQSKYTLECVNCGDRRAAHKAPKKEKGCVSCCTKHNAGNFSSAYRRRLITNF